MPKAPTVTAHKGDREFDGRVGDLRSPGLLLKKILYINPDYFPFSSPLALKFKAKPFMQ